MHFPREILSRLPSLTILLIAIVYSLCLSPLICSSGIWINDEGNRMLGAAACAETGGTLEDPFAEMNNPGLTSYPEPFFIPANEPGRFRSAYSIVPLRIMGVLHSLGGFPLIRLAVFAAALAGLWILGLAARIAGCGQRQRAMILLAAGFGTPLFFYAGVMFEYTGAFLLLACSILMLAPVLASKTAGKKELLLFGGSAVFLALAAYLREESYVLFPAAFAALAICRVRVSRIVLFALVLLGAVAPLWILNYADSGSIFGIHSAVYDSIRGPAMTVPDRVKSFFFFVFQSNATGLAGTGAAAISILVLFFGFLPDDKPIRIQIKAIVAAVLAAAGLVNLFFLVRQTDPMSSTHLFQSVAAFVPFLLFPILFFRSFLQNRDREKTMLFLLVLGILSVLGIGVLLDFRLAGIFFGPRHFTAVLPIFALPFIHAVFRFEERTIPVKIIRWSAFLLICTSIAAQAYGVRLLKIKKNWSDETVRTCAALQTPLIATDVFWVPEELADLHGKTNVAYLTDPSGTRALSDYAQKRGIRRFHMLLSDHFANIPNSALDSLSQKWNIHFVCAFSDPALKFMELRLIELQRLPDENKSGEGKE